MRTDAPTARAGRAPADIHSVKSPIARGSGVAVVAAVLFGATTPLVKHFGHGVGAFATAALLYAGSTLGAGSPRSREAEAPVRRGHAARIAIVAMFGAVIAPVCLAWGLQRTDAVAGSLLLNLEAVFTVLLAWLLYRESIGRRVALAVVLMMAGGAILAMRAPGNDGSGGAGNASIGLVAIAAATLAWAIDSTLTRPLADIDPRAVVFWKSALGAALSSAIAWASNEHWPSASSALALFACGAAGYGLSLRAYLRAQRVLGAGRTASLFAVAPFVGAFGALLFGERHGLASVGVAGALFAIAVVLHLTERHAHTHRHVVMAHEHAHRHDDGHHDHVHVPPFDGEHSHPHEHSPREHTHPHGPDAHHRHGHDHDHES